MTSIYSALLRFAATYAALAVLLFATQTSSASAQVQTAGSLYLENCAICHGEAGTGPTNSDYQGSVLVGNEFVRKHDDADLKAFLKNGRDADAPDSKLRVQMPPFGFLNESEINLIVQFLRTLAGKSVL
jgi:mono/diheme cytochrome c family protein